MLCRQACRIFAMRLPDIQPTCMKRRYILIFKTKRTIEILEIKLDLVIPPILHSAAVKIPHRNLQMQQIMLKWKHLLYESTDRIVLLAGNEIDDLIHHHHHHHHVPEGLGVFPVPKADIVSGVIQMLICKTHKS